MIKTRTNVYSLPEVGRAMNEIARNAAAQETALTSYDSSWTASTVNPSIGNGTLESYFSYSDVRVWIDIKLTLGSTTTTGTGTWRFSLPDTPVGTPSGELYTMGQLSCYNSGVSLYTGVSYVSNGISYIEGIIGNPNSGLVTDSHPFAWGSSDALRISITYQVGAR